MTIAVIMVLGAFALAAAQTAVPTAPKVSGLFRSYWERDMVDSGTDPNYFKIANARFVLKGDLNNITSYTIMADFGGANGDYLLDAFITMSPLGWSKITLGQFKTPFSTVNLRGTADQRFVLKPIVSSKAAPSVYDIGASLELSKGAYSATVGILNGDKQNQTDDNTAKNIASRFAWKPVKNVNFSANAYFGKTDDVDSLAKDLSAYDFGAHLDYQHFSVEGEYGLYDNETSKRAGFFADALYEFTFAGELQSITPGIRYELYDPDTDLSDNNQTAVTYGVRAAFKDLPNMHFRLNYQDNSADSGAPDDKFMAEVQLKF
jgi:hypothetical protein